MAGPCSVESREQILSAPAGQGRRRQVLRGGAFKPRTSPYGFQGLGLEGLKLLREVADATGLQVITEVMEISQIELMLPYIDCFQVGARNMQNFNSSASSATSASPSCSSAASPPPSRRSCSRPSTSSPTATPRSCSASAASAPSRPTPATPWTSPPSPSSSRKPTCPSSSTPPTASAAQLVPPWRCRGRRRRRRPAHGDAPQPRQGHVGRRPVPLPQAGGEARRPAPPARPHRRPHGSLSPGRTVSVIPRSMPKSSRAAQRPDEPLIGGRVDQIHSSDGWLLYIA